MILKFHAAMEMTVGVHSLKNRNLLCHICDWSIKNAGRDCFGRKDQRKLLKE